MEALPLTWVIVVMQILGLPGLIFVVWHFDNKKFAKQESARKQEMQTILDQYRKDVTDIRRLYENNAGLASRAMENYERLERLHNEVVSVISLNTQTYTRLTDAIANNQFCPVYRARGGTGA